MQGRQTPYLIWVKTRPWGMKVSGFYCMFCPLLLIIKLKTLKICLCKKHTTVQPIDRTVLLFLATLFSIWPWLRSIDRSRSNRLTVMQKLTKYASSTESSSLSMSMVLCSDVRQMALSSSVKVEQAHLKRNNSIESKEQHEEAQGQIKSPKTWQMITEQSWWSHKWQNSVCAALREYMWPCVKTKIESISLVIFLIITVTHFRWALAIYIHFGMCLCFYCPQ